MSAEERKKILQLVADAKISADEAANLMRVLEEAAGDENEFAETQSNFGWERSDASEFEAVRKRARRWALIPIWLGILMMVLSGWGMYAISQNVGYNFWFFCLAAPLFLGIAVIALTAGAKGLYWLYVNVDRTQARDWPRKITIAFPLPLGLVTWFLKNFGDRIDGLKKTNVDEILMALSTTAAVKEPFIVNVDESADGDRVQVFIGYGV
ncbi:MAG: hypothetical protein IT310_06640 [Anaerolineales bacterium]|nr:hypothetical protein [Anaerolineales bacterium]